MGVPGGVAGHPRGPFAVHSFPDPLNASMDSICLKMATSGFQPKSLDLLEVQGGQVLPHQVGGDGVVGGSRQTWYPGASTQEYLYFWVP